MKNFIRRDNKRHKSKRSRRVEIKKNLKSTDRKGMWSWDSCDCDGKDGRL